MQNVNWKQLLTAIAFALIVLVGSSLGTWAQDHAPAAPAGNAASTTNAATELEHGTAPDAENDAHGSDDGHGHGATTADAHGAAPTHGGDSHGAAGHGEGHETPNAFTPHAGTWVNPVARALFGEKEPVAVKEDHTPYAPGEKRGIEVHFTGVKYDYLVISFILMALLAALGIAAGKKAQIRPEGKPNSVANAFEAAADGYRDYLIGVMGKDLANKYAPLIASFFFTILLFNWTGLIPGLMSPTANPNVPFALAFVSFFMVHIIAIKETGFKAWFLHLVGEPRWMAPLMFPLHVVGELVKPISLALRLLGNVFGEEIVVAKLIGLALLAGIGLGLPTFIPLQLPIMLLGVFFGFLQALVFSTLLAIYIAILGTHHDDHDAHNAHGHVEHTHVGGHHQYVSHTNELTIG